MFCSFSGGSVVKNPAANAGDSGLIPSYEDPLEKEMASQPVFFPRKSHGWRSLAGSGSWGCKRVGHNLATEQQQQQLTILVLMFQPSH